MKHRYVTRCIAAIATLAGAALLVSARTPAGDADAIATVQRTIAAGDETRAEAIVLHATGAEQANVLWSLCTWALSTRPHGRLVDRCQAAAVAMVHGGASSGDVAVAATLVERIARAHGRTGEAAWAVARRDAVRRRP